MFDTITSKASPTAASQAANTRRMIGSMAVRTRWLFRIKMDDRTNSDSIIPSRHSRADIRCERNNRRPRRDVAKASIMFT